MKVEEILKTTKPLPENKRLVINLLISNAQSSALIAETLKPFGISSPQFNVLRILRGQNGKPANLGTIQERMVNKMSNTTRLVDKLIDKQLVERCVCEKNRRKVEILITQKGLDLLKDIDPVVEATEQNIAKNLDQNEVIQLNDLLEKLRD